MKAYESFMTITMSVNLTSNRTIRERADVALHLRITIDEINKQSMMEEVYTFCSAFTCWFSSTQQTVPVSTSASAVVALSNEHPIVKSL